MAQPQIVLVSQTTLVPPAELTTVAAALDRQVQEHFAPIWGSSAEVVARTPVPGDWVVYLRDHSDVKGALGYHDRLADGRPVGYVFVADDHQYGLEWTVTASHEVLEMVLDPFITRAEQVSSSKWAATEACDPVEADGLGYRIDGVLVSDFLCPAWFDPRAARGSRFDYQGALTKPLTLARGGYCSIWTPGQGWRQHTAETHPGDGVSIRAGRATRHLHRQDRLDSFERIHEDTAAVDPYR